MSVPLIVVSTFRVKEGKLEELKRYCEKILKIVETNEPQMIAFNIFLNEAETEMTSVQVHPDTASMDFHMQVLRENWDEFSDYSQLIEGIGIAYYGIPPESALNMDVQSDFGLDLKSLHVAGFTRAVGVAQ